jgi:hypothetical protein
MRIVILQTKLVAVRDCWLRRAKGASQVLTPAAQPCYSWLQDFLTTSWLKPDDKKRGSQLDPAYGLAGFAALAGEKIAHLPSLADFQHEYNRLMDRLFLPRQTEAEYQAQILGQPA